MIIVTGGAGFIGSNLVHELNSRGIDDIVVVDDLTDGRKFANISQAQIADYLDFEEFRAKFTTGLFGRQNFQPPFTVRVLPQRAEFVVVYFVIAEF